RSPDTSTLSLHDALPISSSWVADNPRPIDVQAWRLSLGGAVAIARDFSYDELVSAGDALEATLDCTGGFYSTQRWRGINIGHLRSEEHTSELQSLAYLVC